MVCGGRGKEDRSGQRGEDLVRKMMEKREVCPVGVGFGGMVGSFFFFVFFVLASCGSGQGDEGND